MGCVLMLGLLGACRTTEEGATREARLTVKSGASLEQAPVCGAELPACAEGKSCIAFTLEGERQARCLDATTACSELLSCSDGARCVLMESYPLQLRCSSP
jgi:hypothetical protein